MNIIQKIKKYILKNETLKVKPIEEDIVYTIHLIEQGLRNGWYKEVTKIEPIEKDIEFLKKHFPMPDYISRLEARIEEIKRGKE